MRASNRFDRVCRRLAEIAKSRLTPLLKRMAWQRFQADGTMPTDPALRDLVERLRDAKNEFREIHQPAPTGDI
ncbi:MAG: hypothetical protein GX448_06700 [Planctomycetes bacterium]|nr:hypothetical protein [Planctomycetota bacterium]